MKGYRQIVVGTRLLCVFAPTELAPYAYLILAERWFSHVSQAAANVAFGSAFWANAQQICPQSIDWGDVATWVASTATFIAVWVALTASNREHERTIKLRDEEWDRERIRVASRTARLAITFHKELLRAAMALMANANAVRAALDADEVRAAVEVLRSGFSFEGLPLMARFADQLEGFNDIDAIAILNAISIWRGISAQMPASIAAAPDSILRQVASDRADSYDEAIKLFKELQENLERYFSHVPELKVFSYEDSQHARP